MTTQPDKPDRIIEAIRAELIRRIGDNANNERRELVRLLAVQTGVAESYAYGLINGSINRTYTDTASKIMDALGMTTHIPTSDETP